MGTVKTNRYIKLLIIALGAVAIYLLPYLRWTYYDTLLEAVKLTNTQFAATMSIYGVAAMIFYAPGGFLADKFSPRKLLSFAFLITGILGIWYSTFPGYMAQMVIFFLWGAIGTAFFWSSMMKVTRSLGNSNEQGRMFGLLEGSRGLFNVLASVIGLYFFSKVGESVGGIAGILIAFSVLCMVSAVLVWFFIDDKMDGGSDAIHLKDIGTVLKIPAVWIVAIVVLSCYSIYLGSTYMTPYMTEMLGLSATVAGVVAIIRNYVLQLAAAPVGGFISDKIGSVVTVIGASFVLIIAGLAGFVFLPATPNVLLIVLVLMLVFVAAIFAIRGIYFAPLEECSIPRHLSGTAVGVISVIGFFPDVYMNAIAGKLFDAYPGAPGYKYLFAIMLGFAILGTIASVVLSRNIKKAKATNAEKNQ